MTTTFHTADPDAHIVYPVTDSEGGDVDWANPTVMANTTEIAATWLGVPAPTRDLDVPLADLPVGTYDLWLVVPSLNDIYLGRVVIAAGVDPAVGIDCLWPLDPGCLEDTWAGLDSTTQLRVQTYATATLRHLTAGRIGVCPITVRPILTKGCCWVNDPFDPYRMSPLNWNGQWSNCVNGPYDRCVIHLPPPVGRIDEVKVDGVVLPTTDYRLLNGRELVYMGAGDCPWPLTQDVAQPDTEVGTMSITYLNAAPVDALAAHAAGVLAVEFAKSCTTGKCKLPANVTTIVRQGVTFQKVAGAFPDGLTGIREVDAFVAMWNPNHVTQQPTVWYPGMTDRMVVES